MYKTIILEMLRSHRELAHQLKTERRQLEVVIKLAEELKQIHSDLQAQLTAARPNSDPSQIASEALEMAMKQIEDGLNANSETDSPPSLDGAMAYLKRHTPTA